MKPQDKTPALLSGPVAITLMDVRTKVKLSHSTIYKLIAEGKFPKPAKIGRRSIWLIAEIDAWIEAQFATRKPD